MPQLVALAQTGDEQAKADLLQRAIQLVYARVLRSLKGSAEADDVAQDTLLAALRDLPRLRDPTAFLPWLRRITDNTIADHLAGRRQRAAQSEELVNSAVDGRQASQAALIRAEQQQFVRAALAALTPKRRVVVELFYFHDLTCREVANFLGVSHDAARATLSRARRDLRRNVMAQTVEKEQRTERYWVMFVSGDSTFRGGLFDRGSETDRLYRALYPYCDDVAAAAADLSPARTQQQLRLLQDMGLIVQRDDGWRCTMPLVNEIDRELIHAWAAPIAEVVIGRLGAIHDDLALLSESVDGESAKATVTAIGLMEAAARPFAPLQEHMKLTEPDRGRFGRFRVVVFTCRAPACTTFIGGYGRGDFESGGARGHTYYFWPLRTRRPGIQALDSAFASGQEGVGISHVILDKLAPFADSDVTPKVKDRIAEQLAIPADRRDEFWKRLTDLHAAGELGGRTRVIVPRLRYEPWQSYLSSLDAISPEIENGVTEAADDLRKRTLHCSFADCNFADTVLAFLVYLEGMVKEAISERGWLVLPAEADFSWGALIVV